MNTKHTPKILVISFVIICMGFPRANAADYYVSTSGNDTNSGTEASPWKTIQHAADSVDAGDTVYIRGGTYSEQVNITKSGSASGGYITFQNYPDETPVIDGTSITPGSSQSALLTIENQNYIKIQGLEICNFKTSDQDSIPIGIYVNGYGSYIQILNNTVHHIEHNNVTQSAGNAHGIAVYATNGTNSINNITISGNTVRNCKLGSSESMVLNGNVEIFTVSDNTVHDNDNIGIDFIGWEGTAPENDQARNGTVSRNIVYNISSKNNPAYTDLSAGGIYVDGGKDIIIERNKVFSCDIGIEIGCEHKNKTVDNVTVRDNLLFSNNITGLGFGGYDSNRGIILNCKFQHNTFFKNDTTNSGTGEVMIQRSHDNVFSCNIFYCGAQDIFITNYFTSANSYNNTFDYNVYFSPDGSDNCVFVWQDESYSGFTAFKVGSGLELNSAFGNPEFVNDSSDPPDLHPQLSSPAINAGDPSFSPGAGELDYDGNARVVDDQNDCGAYEYNSEDKVTLTMAINPEGDGTTSPGEGTHSVNAEVFQHISAIPEPGCSFSGWTATAGATFADASSSDTTVTLTENATVTANFLSGPDVEIKLAAGSVIQIYASEVGLDEFTAKPKISGVYNDKWFKMNILDKINKNNQPLYVNAEWTKKLCIYDKTVYNRKVRLGDLLVSNPIQDLLLDSVSVIANGTETKLDNSFYLANPVIESVVGNIAAKSSLTVDGRYFGAKIPVLYVEYLKKGNINSPAYKKCKIDKTASSLYMDAKRKPLKSCMVVYDDDPVAMAYGQTAGYSKIIAIYPSLSKTDVSTGYIILDNGIGLAAFYLE